MKKTETCMHITTDESIEDLYQKIKAAVANHRERVKKECQDYKRYNYVEQQYLFFFTRKVKVEYTAEEYAAYVISDKDIANHIGRCEFEYRNHKRLMRLNEFISYAYKTKTGFDLSLSDYEYIRLWVECPDDWHTRYNAALY